MSVSPFNVIVMSYVNGVCYVVLSVVPSVYNTALEKHTGLQVSGHIWHCNNSIILYCSTNGIRAMYCMIRQLFVPCM